MVTLILEANRIPEGRKVRKATGQQEYVLQRELKIHVPGDARVIKTEGMVFLTSERSINAYPESTRFALDLTEAEAIELLDNLISHK